MSLKSLILFQKEFQRELLAHTYWMEVSVEKLLRQQEERKFALKNSLQLKE
jgi:hypothetical protein